MCVSGTKSGTLSNVLMGGWLHESSLSYSLPTPGESPWMDSIQLLNTEGNHQVCMGNNISQYEATVQEVFPQTWLNTIRVGLEHQKMVFPITKSKTIITGHLENNISMYFE